MPKPDHSANVKVHGRYGPEIGTESGGRFHLLYPQPDEFKIEDIAHSLANQCRFVGHTKVFYSVAQHSIHVSRLVPQAGDGHAGYALDGLLHDAAEAYVGDMSRPLKLLLESEGVHAYNEIEGRIMERLSKVFGIGHPLAKCVHEADQRALATERRDVMAPILADYNEGLPDPDPMVIVPLSPIEAKSAFLVRYIELTREAAS